MSSKTQRLYGGEREREGKILGDQPPGSPGVDEKKATVRSHELLPLDILGD
jgi:hypothetical protein